jgi:hypothetical protein
LALRIAPRRFRREPGVAAGPVALVLADRFTLLVDFGPASFLLSR